jgi:hypothetical protein
MRKIPPVFPLGSILRPGARVYGARVHGGRVVTYFFPGLWMADAELDRLRSDLEDIARDRLGALPDYGVFLPARAPYDNRIVTLLYRGDKGAPVAFSAMVHCPVRSGDRTIDVLNLGLSIARRSAAGNSPLPPLYVRPLFRYYIYRLMRPFWIATFTARPTVIGAIADTLSDVYPHYRRNEGPTPDQIGVARQIFDRWRDESGVAPSAEIDENTFVVRASCAGPSAILRHDFDNLPKYQVPFANEFCRRMLDYDRGDELLMVGRVDGCAALRALLGRLGSGR